MPQQPVELILVRQLASALATPVTVVDVDGEFVYFNEAAGVLFGCPLEQIGDLGVDQVSELFSVTDQAGEPIPTEEMLLAIALREERPAHRTFVITGLDGVSRRLTSTAFPLIAQGGRLLGAVGFLWEEPGEPCT